MSAPPDAFSYLDLYVGGNLARYQPRAAASSSSAITQLLGVRESEVLNLIAQGRGNKEIARILSISPETVKSHVKRIFSKLKVEKRAQAVSRAYILGLARSA